MQRSATNIVVWRCLIVMLAVVASVQLAIETFHAPRELSLGVRGERLFEGSFLRERGRTTDKLSGHREMQTLRNDPKQAPTRKL